MTLDRIAMYILAGALMLILYLRFRKQLKRIFGRSENCADTCRCEVLMRRNAVLHDSINNRLPATESQH